MGKAMDEDAQIIADEIVSQALASAQDGGLPGYLGEGRWAFVTTVVQLSPNAMNAAFRLMGIFPKPVEPKGSCETCEFSEEGRERGYRRPCMSCIRPIMSNYRSCR